MKCKESIIQIYKDLKKAALDYKEDLLKETPEQMKRLEETGVNKDEALKWVNNVIQGIDELI